MASNKFSAVFYGVANGILYIHIMTVSVNALLFFVFSPMHIQFSNEELKSIINEKKEVHIK